MNEFTNLIGNWHFWALIFAYWVFSNAVGSMPKPVANSSPGYTWLFMFLNGLAANLSRAVAGKIPGVQNGGTDETNTKANSTTAGNTPTV